MYVRNELLLEYRTEHQEDFCEGSTKQFSQWSGMEYHYEPGTVLGSRGDSQ